MALQGLLFDVEDIFFDGTFWHRYLHQTICRLGRPEKFAEFQAAWQTKFLPNVYSGKVQYWDALASFFGSLGLNEVEIRELIVASQSKLKQAQSNLRLFPAVNESLLGLKKSGIRVGIVCNSIHQPDRMSEMLRNIGLKVEFEFVLTSRAGGRVLPDRAALEAGCHAFGLRPEMVGYVSSRAERLDVAKTTGLIPISINKKVSFTPNLNEASIYNIASLADLSKVIMNVAAENLKLTRPT